VVKKGKESNDIESSKSKSSQAYGGDEEEKKWILNCKVATYSGHHEGSNLIMSLWVSSVLPFPQVSNT
jgi:hypothetical protein